MGRVISSIVTAPSSMTMEIHHIMACRMRDKVKAKVTGVKVIGVKDTEDNRAKVIPEVPRVKDINRVKVNIINSNSSNRITEETSVSSTTSVQFLVVLNLFHKT